MKNLAYLLLTLSWISLISCSDEEATSIAESVNEFQDAEISSKDYVQLEKTLDVRVRISKLFRNVHMSYSGAFPIVGGGTFAFSTACYFDQIGQKFQKGTSEYVINGRQYIGYDYSDETGKGIVSFLTLKLPNGRLVPKQGWIWREHILFFDRYDNLNGIQQPLVPVSLSNEETDLTFNTNLKLKIKAQVIKIVESTAVHSEL